jgi:hypothetical protein
LTLISIIFVHGLAGNREKTWTHKKGTFWPQHLLARDFSSTRIMTFGYDVDVTKLSTFTSSNRIYDHGQSLAYALVSQREKCSTRPILFIAHGFGGLVCQQALILGTQVDGLWQISSCAIGIIFMGTPHYGSSLACHNERLEKYLNATHKAQKETMVMKPGPNYLQRVANEFQHMLHRGDISLKVFCFYETKQVNDAVGKIVEEGSAILKDYKNCRIEANHFNMAKFSGRFDAGYEHIRNLIAALIEKFPGEDKTVISEASKQVNVDFPNDYFCPGTTSSAN